MNASNQVTFQQHLGMTSSLSEKNDSLAKNSVPCPPVQVWHNVHFSTYSRQCV